MGLQLAGSLNNTIKAKLGFLNSTIKAKILSHQMAKNGSEST
jgi:hypothetical protein